MRTHLAKAGRGCVDYCALHGLLSGFAACSVVCECCMADILEGIAGQVAALCSGLKLQDFAAQMVYGVTGHRIMLNTVSAKPAGRCMMIFYMMCLSLSLRRKFLPASQGHNKKYISLLRTAPCHTALVTTRTAASHAGAPQH